MVARWAHNPKVIGSNPFPATKQGQLPLEVALILSVIRALFRGGEGVCGLFYRDS